MTKFEFDLITKKSKNKKDGVYSLRGNLYTVKDGKFTAYVDYLGNCFEVIGKILKKVETLSTRKELVKWIKLR